MTFIIFEHRKQFSKTIQTLKTIFIIFENRENAQTLYEN